MSSIFAESRELRPVWAKYLLEANDIAKKSNNLRLNPATHAHLIQATFANLEIPQQKKVVRVFVSSTFTDTELERNLLMVDVFPYLTQLCRLFGVQFEVVDMRWGVREFTNDDHGTYNLCMSELHKCRRESLGPAFFCLLGDKYGFRPFPNTVVKEELEAMWQQILPHELAKIEKLLPDITKEILPVASSVPLATLWASLDAKFHRELEAHNLLLVPKWFKLDNNNNPAIYVLQNITTYMPEFRSENKELRQVASNKWWTIFEDLQLQLRLGSAALAEADRNKYFISVTEAEVHNGILLNGKRDSQSFFCRRQISDAANFPTDIRYSGKFVDLDKKNTVDSTAHEMLGSLKKEVGNLLEKENICEFEVSPTLIASPSDSEIPQQQKYLREFVDIFCEKMVKAIFGGYISKNLTMTPLEQELVQQYYFHENKCANLIDRPDITSSLENYLSSDSRTPHCLVGESGSGKTSLMALMAPKIKEKFPESFVVYRFIGITPASSGARQLLQSLYTQIYQLLVKKVNKNGDDEDEEDDAELEAPSDFSVLVQKFSELLNKTNPQHPLFIFLDSLDQLSNEDSGHSLRWLPWSLPENVHLVISVLNTQKIYETIKLHKSMSEACFTFVSRITTADAMPIMKSLLSIKGRRISDEQLKIAEKAFEECPLPLYVKVASDIMSKWTSYIPAEFCLLANSLPNLISQSVLHTIELVHGEKLVSHALGLISAAKDGISSKELEDILSCTEEVLCDVYQWWKPPLRVLPPMLWKRIRDDLGGYLIERGSSGAIVYRWYHRQFWEAAENRYLKNEKGDGVSQREARHLDLANYFDGIWSSPNKVPYIDEFGKQAECDRLITKQPLQFSATVFNLRKLSELPYHHTLSNVPARFETSLFNFDFIAAKCAAKLHHELVQDYQFAIQNLDGAKHSDYLPRLQYFLEFVEKNLHILSRFPHQSLQLALNSPDVLQITSEAKNQATNATHPFINWVNKSQEIDPCIKTYVHSEQIYNFSLAQDGNTNIVALMSEKSTRVSVINLNTCTEITKYTLARPVTCVKLFENGKKLLVGTSSSLQIFDVASNEIIFTQQTGYVAACDVSPDGVWLISAGEELLVWNVDKKEILTKLDDGESSDSTKQAPVERAYSHCHISPLGDIFVTVRIETENISIWDAANFQLRGKINGVHTTKNSPCSISFSNNGKYLVTTSIDDAKGKCVIWDVYSRTQIRYVTAKFGAEFGCLSSDENSLLVAEGQLLRVYDASTQTALCSYQGHRGEVSAVKYLPGGKYFISASVDKTLRIWDTSVQQVTGTDYRAEEGNVRACKFAPDGATFSYASPHMEGFVKIGKFGTKPAPRKAFKIWPQKLQIYSLVHSPYGILVSHKGLARLIDPATGKIKGEYKCPGIIRANISPDGKLIGCATNSTPNSFHLFDTASAKEISSSNKPFFGNHKYATDFCVFSPDGTRVATGGQYLSIIDLSPPYNQIQLADSWHTQFVECCAFSPDGTLLAAEGELVKKIRMWKASTKGEQKHHLMIWDKDGIKFTYEVRGSIKTVKFLSNHYIFVLEQHAIWLFDLRTLPLAPLATFLRPSSARFSSGDMFGNSIVAFDEMGTVYYFTVSNFDVTN